MTSRERVLAAVNRRTPDRVPVDIGGTTTTTMTDVAYGRLKACLGIQGGTRLTKSRSRTVLPDEEVALRLGSDTRPVLPGLPDGWQDIFHPDGSIQDEFGIVWRAAAGGHYAAMGNPLAGATLDDLAAFPWPDAANPGRSRGVGERTRLLQAETGCAVCLSLPSGPVHLSQYLRGYENWLVDMVTDRRFFDALLDRCLQWWLELAGPVLDAAGSAVDVVMFGDDVAFHDRPMVDLKRHREIFKPRHRQMVELIKHKTGAKVLYHCCGAVRKLVPDFIDMGIDALNPVQVSSAGMDTAALKAEFGRDVCFWGGIDTQHVMPHGTPGDVYSEVERRIRDLAPGGGYVLAAVHNLQDDVPPENILAMADAAREYGA